MKTVYKYKLGSGLKAILIHNNAELLTVQTQGNDVCLWAMVDTEEEMVNRYFEIFGTGHEIPVGMGIARNYIATFQIPQEGLVFHVFERLN